MTRVSAFLFSLPCVVLGLATSAAHAQYPSRPITLVVPYTAGSDADLSARNLAEHAARYLNGKILITNQPGASGGIGSQAVRNAAPDGYTLLLARTASVVILPATDSKTPYQWSDLLLTARSQPVCAGQTGRRTERCRPGGRRPEAARLPQLRRGSAIKFRAAAC
jgi:tripartite-type tricarboxylate transporter receptor subunit TctC